MLGAEKWVVFLLLSIRDICLTILLVSLTASVNTSQENLGANPIPQ